MADNPCLLARDIRGIGFRAADTIATRLGIEPAAIIRLRAGINDALLEASGVGHYGLLTAELLKLAGACRRVPLDPSLIQSALDLECSEGSVVADTLASKKLLIQLCAPTDWAAMRLAEVAGLEAGTICTPSWRSGWSPRRSAAEADGV